MGGVSSTRRLTVINDNSSGVIRISESVVKKLKREERDKNSTEDAQQSRQSAVETQSQQQTQPQQSLQQQQQQQTQQLQQQRQTLPIVDSSPNSLLMVGSADSAALREQYEQEIKRLERSWKSQVNEYDKQNQRLWNLANDKLTANVTAVANKYGNRKAQPICQENRQKVTDCYQTNKSQPLKCSKEVRNFIDCVHAMRSEVLTNNG